MNQDPNDELNTTAEDTSAAPPKKARKRKEPVTLAPEDNASDDNPAPSKKRSRKQKESTKMATKNSNANGKAAAEAAFQISVKGAEYSVKKTKSKPNDTTIFGSFRKARAAVRAKLIEQVGELSKARKKAKEAAERSKLLEKLKPILQAWRDAADLDEAKTR